MGLIGRKMDAERDSECVKAVGLIMTGERAGTGGGMGRESSSPPRMVSDPLQLFSHDSATNRA